MVWRCAKPVAVKRARGLFGGIPTPDADRKGQRGGTPQRVWITGKHDARAINGYDDDGSAGLPKDQCSHGSTLDSDPDRWEPPLLPAFGGVFTAAGRPGESAV